MKFWEDSKGLVWDIRIGEKILSGGDLNGHVESEVSGYKGLYGRYGLGEANTKGKTIRFFFSFRSNNN